MQSHVCICMGEETGDGHLSYGHPVQQEAGTLQGVLVGQGSVLQVR